jgi:hypothetical protein
MIEWLTRETEEPSKKCQLVAASILLLLTIGACTFPIGYHLEKLGKLVEPSKFFVELEEGCNITKIEYEFTKEKDRGDERRLGSSSRARPKCADTYTYSFSTLTDPPMHYQDKHITKKYCRDADEIKKSTLRMGNITKCWRFVSPNPLSKLTDAERKTVIEYYECYNEDCAKVIDPGSYYKKPSGLLTIIGIATLAGGLLLILISVAVFCKSNHKGQSRSNPVAAVAHTTDRNEKSKTKKDTKTLVKKMQLTGLVK